MGRWRNTCERFGAAAIALHWVMAALLGLLIASGLYMTSLPDAGFDNRKIMLILYHKQLGMAALALVLARIGWRAANALPVLAETLPEWQQVSARLAHLVLYALMLALPLTGWLLSSAGGFPVSLFGLFDLPDLVPASDRLFHAFIAVHQWLGYALVALALVHAAAALRHHFVLHDATLTKMLR